MLRISLFAIAIVCGLCMLTKATAEPIDPGSLGSTVPKAEQPAQMQELVDAEERFRQRDIAGSLELLQAAVKKNPDLPPAHVLLADLFAYAQNASGVRAALEQAVTEDPADPQAYLRMAELALRERRLTEAKLLFEKANALLAKWTGSAKRKEGMTSQLNSGLASLEEAHGNWAEARKYLDNLLKLTPENAVAWVRLAQCLFQEKNIDSALEKLKEAAKHNKQMLPPEAVLAQWFARAGDQEKAQKWMVDAINAAPRNPQVRLVYAQWAWETGNLDEAVKQADAALQLDPDYHQALILRGIIALFRKNYEKAEMQFEAARIKSPGDYAASNNLALALAEQKDPSKLKNALYYAETNVKQHPNLADAYSTYGWVLYKLGRLNEAYASLRKALSGGKFSADTAYYMACVLADQGQDANAVKFLDAALKSPAPFSKREEAQKLLAQLEAAQPKAVQPQPDSPAGAKPAPSSSTTPPK